jgi:hypothetical protein
MVFEEQVITKVNLQEHQEQFVGALCEEHEEFRLPLVSLFI